MAEIIEAAIVRHDPAIPLDSTLDDADRVLALIRPAPVASGGQHSSGEGELFLEVIPDRNVEGCYRTVVHTPASVAETAGEAEQTALNIICDPGIITGLHTAAEARDWIEKSVRAALLSKKKPTSEEVDARRRLINLIEQWDGESEYDAEDCASLADDILHAFNGSPVLSSSALGYVSADAEAALKAGINRVIYPAPSAHASFPLYASPVPAQDDDKLRLLADRVTAEVKRGAAGSTVQALGALSNIEGLVLAALKSTAAKEGGA